LLQAHGLTTGLERSGVVSQGVARERQLQPGVDGAGNASMTSMCIANPLQPAVRQAEP